jgi:hypothetical protein
MAVFFITGKLGSGKTLVTVGKIKEYLMQGKKVATNLDLNIEKLTKRNSKNTFYRLPDKPRASDFAAIGRGSEFIDESTYGIIVLDECATWLNARTWNDKERKGFIDFMLHARKLGWDVYIIIQNIELIDRQLRIALCEHLVVCRRLDRMKIPFISNVVKMLTGERVTMPKIHTAKVFYGDTESSVVSDRWTYQGKNLYDAYDTRQAFQDDIEIYKEKEIDMRAMYSGLSRWHLDGRYFIKKPWIRITHPFQILLLPTWGLICLIKLIHHATAHRSAV